jgi:hypothetical protein
MQPLNDNPRLGFESKNPALHPGHNVCQSTVALRLSWSVASEARQSEVMGRFMSPDPSRLSINPKNPQTWNRYAYVYNNPLGLKDDNGKWPTAIHDQIIDNAFPNLSPSQRQILKNVSADQDSISVTKGRTTASKADSGRRVRGGVESRLSSCLPWRHAMAPTELPPNCAVLIEKPAACLPEQFGRLPSLRNS